MNKNTKALDARARRAAKRVGLVARKWRARVGTLENEGGFMLVEPSRNIPEAGFRYDMTAQEVIDYCRDLEAQS